MCGIAGLIGVGGNATHALPNMIRALSHRGPDSDGIVSRPFAAIGARRLSIIDAGGGDQPIANEDGTLHIVFNGEIYNYRELRSELVARGHRFKTKCDTEVILHLYEEHGVRCAEHLRGMFAFAILSENSVFIARDRFGIKPLHFFHDPVEGCFGFASEIKALLQWPALDVSISIETLADRYVLGYPTRGQTPFAGIASLQPGHYLLASQTSSGLKVTQSRYFTLSVEPDSEIALDDAVGSVRAALEESVARHVHADASVAVNLSGGLDSSLLAFLASRHLKGQAHTFTVASSSGLNDLHAASDVAQHLGASHSEVVVSFPEYLEAIPAYIKAGETCDGLHGLPFFLLCKSISPFHRVCLNGEGADELFGGYWSYLRPQPTLRAFKQRLAAARRIGLPVTTRAAGIVEYLLGSTNWAMYVQRLLLTFQQEQLEYNHLALLDHYAMAFGIELRVPYLDDALACIVNALPVRFKVNRALDCGKYLLRKIALQYGRNAFGDDPILRGKEGMPSAGQEYYSRFEAMCGDAVPDSWAGKHEFRNVFCTRDANGCLHGKSELILFEMFRETFISRRGSENGPSVQEVLGAQALRVGSPLHSDAVAS